MELMIETIVVVRRLKRMLSTAFIGVLCLVGHALAQGIQEPEMVSVAGGTFTMGCTFEQGVDCGFDEKPTHEVQLTGFSIAKYEVTQALWKQVMGNNPSRFKGDSLPVENVCWDDVQIFLQRLNTLTGKNYRLPTEAEWEYAARGGNQSQQKQFSGDFEVAPVAWCNTNSKNTTHAVGGKQPNELGLYDMSGNVWEWCSDYYGTYSSSRQVNPKGAKKGTGRVLRGGCFTGSIQQCRVAARKSQYSGNKDYMTGFRLAMDDEEAIRAEAAAQQVEQNRVVAEKAAKGEERERIAAEKKAEQDRIATEKAAAEANKKAEQERIAAEKKLEQERIAAEKKAEQDRRSGRVYVPGIPNTKADYDAYKKAIVKQKGSFLDMSSMAYKEYLKYHKHVAAGATCTVLGLGAFISGTTVFLISTDALSDWTNNREQNIFSASLAGVGLTLFIAGTATLGARNKHMQKSYQYYINGEKQTATLNFHPYFDNHNTMGVGLTIRF